MKLRNLFSAASVALFTSTPLFAGDLMVMDAYARVASKVAKSGAAFMMIHNHSDQDDRLIAAASGFSQAGGSHDPPAFFAHNPETIKNGLHKAGASS